MIVESSLHVKFHTNSTKDKDDDLLIWWFFYFMTRLEKLELALKKGFTYNPETGIIATPKGVYVKRTTIKGYISISIWHNKKRYYLIGHQFAWYFMYKETVHCIDHINQKKDDNRILNLRSVTKSQNAMNIKNVKGYYFCKRQKKYISIIMINYKRKYLGVFNNPEDARKCYLENKEKYHIIN